VILLVPFIFAADVPSLSRMLLDTARRLDSLPVLMWVDVELPLYSYSGETVAGPDFHDDINRAAYLLGEMDVRRAVVP
jgi:hypothetical protein